MEVALRYSANQTCPYTAESNTEVVFTERTEMDDDVVDDTATAKKFFIELFSKGPTGPK